MQSKPAPDNLSSNGTSSVYPRSVGGLEVKQVRDLTTGSTYDSEAPDFKPTLPVGGGEMITFKLENEGINVVMTLRTSGTEPKVSAP